MHYFPVGQDKKPLVDSWKDYRGDPVGNYGVALDSDDLIVDIDPRNGGEFDELTLQDMGALPETKIVTTSGGGRHYYYKKPPQLRIRKKVKNYEGVDFLTAGMYAIGPGSIINGGRYESNNKEVVAAPQILLDIVKRAENSSKSLDLGGIEINKLKELIGHIPKKYSDSYNDWLTIGMAIHASTNGSIHGLTVWDEFSRQSKKYELTACSTKWATFNITDDGVSIGTIYRLALEGGYAGEIGDLLPAVISSEFSRKNPSELIAELKNWIFISGQEGFLNAVDKRFFKSSQMKLYYSMLWPKGDINKMLIARLPHADNLTYAPGKGKAIKNKKGMTLANTWEPSAVIATQGDCEFFISHLQYLLPTDWQIVRDWMAYIVQHAEQRCEWVLVLTGGQGNGKSYLAETLRFILGDSNVSYPSNEGIHEKFTHWAAKQLAVVNEVLAKDRRSLTEKLKPIINSPRTTIRDMRTSEYEIDAVCNIIMFSNHQNPLVLASDDRRYCMLHTNAKRKQQEYYTELWDKTTKNIGCIYNYLLNVDLSNFNMRNAPMTVTKERIIEESMFGDYDLVVGDFVQRGRTIFTYTEVKQELIMTDIEESPSPYRLAAAIKDKAKLVKRLRYNGSIIKIYAIYDVADELMDLNNSDLINRWLEDQKNCEPEKNLREVA